MHIYVDDEDAYDNDDNNDDNHDTVTTAATSTRVTTVAVNGFADAVDDKLLEWLSSCNAAQDDTIHKVSIFVTVFAKTSLVRTINEIFFQSSL